MTDVTSQAPKATEAERPILTNRQCHQIFSTVTRRLVAATAAGSLVVVGAAPALAGAGSDGVYDPTKSSAPLTGETASIGDATELFGGAEVIAPEGTTEYAYTQEVIFWSVTAARPETGKPTVWLYADEENTELLAKSSKKAQRVDFVAVDSNNAEVPMTYFPTVRSRGGTSTVELDNAAGILLNDIPTTVTLAPEDVVICTDVFLDTGVDYKLKVTGADAGDADLYLLRSTADDVDTWYQSRADAVAKSGDHAAGEKEKIVVTGDGSWHVLVMIQQSGSGTYTLKKSPL